MRFNLLISERKGNKIVFDMWFDNLKEVSEMYSNLLYGINKVEYYLHIVDENNNLVRGE